MTIEDEGQKFLHLVNFLLINKTIYLITHFLICLDLGPLQPPTYIHTKKIKYFKIT